MINQCSSCGGFCKKSGCERENVKPTPQRTWVGLTEEELYEIYDESDDGSSPCGVCGACSKCKIEVAIARAIEAKLKQKNGYAEEKNNG